jgi:hypothetical protein
MTTLKKIYEFIKKHTLGLLTLSASIFYLLWRRSRSQAAEEKAKQVAAEKRGELNELAKETKDAEHSAADSRAEYERLADKHRE